MFTYIVWGLVITLLIILAKRIGRGVFGVMVFVGVLFFSIFMLDTFTTLNLREYMSLKFYDKTVEDPVGAASEVSGKIKNAGNKAVDKINDIGKNADTYFEIESSGETGDKTWLKGSPVKQGDTESVVVEEGQSGKKKGIEKKKVLKAGEEVFIAYSDVNKELKSTYYKLPNKDKEIIRSFSPILKTKIEGKNVVVFNNTDRVKDGLFIRIK